MATGGVTPLRPLHLKGDRMSEWPKHPDGRPMKLGEMTKKQQVEQLSKAAAKVQKEFNNPEVQKQLSKIMNKGN